MLMLALTGLATLLAIVPLVWIVGYVVYQGGRYLNWSFFTQLPRPPGVAGGGVLNAIEGTLLLIVLAAVFAIPPGVLAALYTAYNPDTPLGTAVRFGTDVLSGVPSIVIGLFLYALVVKAQGHFSALAGGMALAILMLPIIIRTTEEMVKLVPPSLREGSLALGAPEWKTSLRVVLPAAADGLLTGFLLGLARAAGETAPLLFTALGNDNFEIFTQIRGPGSQPATTSFAVLWGDSRPTCGFAPAHSVEIRATALSGADPSGLDCGAGSDGFCVGDQYRRPIMDRYPQSDNARITTMSTQTEISESSRCP